MGRAGRLFVLGLTCFLALSVVAPTTTRAADFHAVFVRSAKDCNVGTLTLVGVKPAKYGVVGLAWNRGPEYAATIQHKGPGGHGKNWRQRFDAADYRERFPKGAFKLQVNYLWVRYGVAQSIFTNYLNVPACTKY